MARETCPANATTAESEACGLALAVPHHVMEVVDSLVQLGADFDEAFQAVLVASVGQGSSWVIQYMNVMFQSQFALEKIIRNNLPAFGDPTWLVKVGDKSFTPVRH